MRMASSVTSIRRMWSPDRFGQRRCDRTAQHIYPAFICSFRADIAGRPHFYLPETMNFIQKNSERLFREIGKESATPLSFRFSIFERSIKYAILLKRAPDQTQHLWKVGFLNMQQRSAGPNAIKCVRIVQFLKAHAADKSADTLLCIVTQFLASIHSQNMIPQLCEV